MPGNEIDKSTYIPVYQPVATTKTSTSLVNI